jgi:hypothetical protein
MAVMSTESRGRFRSGRYARRSIKIPSAAHTSIAASITKIPPPSEGWPEISSGVKSRKRADHEDVAVREVDEPQHAIDERVADGDERIHRADGKAVDELL